MLKTKFTTIEAEFELVTPAFISGGDQDQADLRPPSIKGALRFWWRALNWGKYLKLYLKSEAALEALHKDERRLFGVAADDEKHSGQGVFLLSIKHELESISKDKFYDNFEAPLEGYQYLLGQGLYSYSSQSKVQRCCLKPGPFKLLLTFRDAIASDDIKQLGDTLLAFGLYGGIGSRSRRGLGSVSIQNLKVCGNDWEIPMTPTTFIEKTKEILGRSAVPEPPFTAFSENSRVKLFGRIASYASLLNLVGDALLVYRSNGRSCERIGYRKIKTSNPEPEYKTQSELVFWKYHELVLDAAKNSPDSTQLYPERLVFGFPHNYFFSTPKWDVIKKYMPDIDSYDRNWKYKFSLELQNDSAVRKKSGVANRRSSPLIIHIHAFPLNPVDDQQSKRYSLVQVFLPAEFLPQGETLSYKFRLEAKNEGESPAQRRIKEFSSNCTDTPKPNWSVIENYLNEGIKPRRFTK